MEKQQEKEERIVDALQPVRDQSGSGYLFRDVFEFQEKYPTKKEREQVLLTLSYDEIMHLARSCGNATGGAYYSQFARLAKERENKQS